MTPPPEFCGICIHGTEGLVRSADGILECVDCRTKDAGCGLYSFSGGRGERVESRPRHRGGGGRGRSSR